MSTWENWLQAFQGPDEAKIADVLDLPARVRAQEWKPTAADRKQAWEFYTELRTRITTQPLHYTEGDEPTALKSVADLFAMSRDLIRKGGPEARHFGTLVTFLLNRVVRPFTARWHKDLVSGSLDNEDLRHEFREKLLVLQDKLRTFGSIIGKLAEGDTEFQPGSESWPERGRPTVARQTDLGEPIPFDRLLFDAAVSEEERIRIRDAERCEVLNRRTAMSQSAAGELNNLAGLAISGGGLRSATFALGVVQGLAEKNMLGQFDYLSTVSGGGYLGSFLSSYLNSPEDPQAESSATPGPRDPAVGPNVDRHPFQKPAVGESAALRHLRSQSKFILNGGTLGRFRMGLQALFGMLTNAAIVFPWIAIVVLLAEVTIGEFIWEAVKTPKYDYFSELFSDNCQRIVSGVFVLLLVLLPMVLRLARRKSCAKIGTGYLWFTSGWLALFLAVTGWNSLPALFRVTDRIGDFFVRASWLPDVLKSEWLGPIGLVVLQLVGRVVGTAGRQKPWAVALKKFTVVTAGPLLLLAVFIILGRTIFLSDSDAPVNWIKKLVGWHITSSEFLLAITALLLVYDHLVLDINLSSLHPFYRARLSEAYLKQHDRSTGERLKGADHTKLSELRRTIDSRAPYHLINAALNSPAGIHPSLRGRRCDFFLFSKHFCGAASTGYLPTMEFEALDPALNLGTAMAISGAAASPFMGKGSGETSFLLALFNIRLDYWLRFPKRRAIPFISWTPGPSYLGRQLLGTVNETSTYVNLSDGGHIENLAIYELLRRRCKFIVAIDGECDPKITCGSLLTLINFAKIDFGIEIKFAYAGGLDRLKPTSTHTSSLVEKHSTATAESKADAKTTTDTPDISSPMLPYHFALARIEYPATVPHGPKSFGWLLYLKSSLTGNEGPTISHYRAKNPEFPHESTADLFYDEEQFEAYRALGHHIAGDVFRSEIVGQTQSPNSIREWFESLKDKLTNPNAL